MVLIRYRTVNGEDEYEWYGHYNTFTENMFWYGDKAVLIDAITPITKQEAEVLSKFYIV